MLILERGEKVVMPPAIWIQGRPDEMHDYHDPEGRLPRQRARAVCQQLPQGRRRHRDHLFRQREAQHRHDTRAGARLPEEAPEVASDPAPSPSLRAERECRTFCRKGVAPLHPSNAPLFVADSRRQVFNAGRSEADDDFVPTRGDPPLGRRPAAAVPPTTSGAQQPPPAAEKLARTYGIDLFGQIEAIRYTFNAQFPGVDLSRSWIWEPKTDQVILRGQGQIGPAGKGHVQAVATR